MPEQGNKYNIPHFKVSLEAFFSRNYSSKQKSFNLSARELHDECSASELSKSFALSIYSRGPMKNSTLGYFCKGGQGGRGEGREICLKLDIQGQWGGTVLDLDEQGAVGY